MRVADIFGPGDVWVQDRPEPTSLVLTDAIIRRRCQPSDERQAMQGPPAPNRSQTLDRSRVSHDNQ